MQDARLKETVSKKVKAQLFNSHVLPDITCTSVTWTNNKTRNYEESRRIKQRVEERKILVALDFESRKRIEVDDIVEAIYASREMVQECGTNE